MAYSYIYKMIKYFSNKFISTKLLKKKSLILFFLHINK